MGDKAFKKKMRESHAKLMKWAGERGIRFVTKNEKEREERKNDRGRRW